MWSNIIEYPVSIEVNGLTLRGMAHQPEQEGVSKHPVVILFHGITGSKIEGKFLFVRFARELMKYGIGCFRFDFSGSGESDGSFAEMTFSGEVQEGKEVVNMVKIVDWVQYYNTYVNNDVTIHFIKDADHTFSKLS
ncbi:hypothetical protein [Pseudalkalibacillus decolorationis]|uniref:hypothetical protein n=1 Tax=Pseudalkalibacillus decolorationis TaxID=163879 RepID=UPI002148AB08|nr:hypothetical protein [Pseudalkalibacillus decolorationis]